MTERNDGVDDDAGVRGDDDGTANHRDLKRHCRVLDEMPASVSIYDADRRFSFANERLAAAYETTADELVGTKSPLLERLRTERPDDPFAELVAGDREVFADTVVLDLPDREGAFIEYELTRLELDGEFDGVLGVFRDVTDERRREKRLERTTARLNALFENSPDMIDIHDRDGTIVDVNRSMCAELGYDADELVGMSVWDVDAEMDPEATPRSWEDLAVGETLRVETTYRRRDGSTFPAEVHVRRIDVQGADRFLVSSRDVSERKAYERQIERENERLDEFASIVSHDLRNPLSVLSGYLDLARETGDETYFDRCENAVEDMERLIDDLLTLARDGKTVGDRESVRLADLTADCWASVEHGDARLALDVDDDVAVLADEGRLKQLLENLFRNSVEHGSTCSRTESGDSVEHGSTGSRPEADDSVEHGSTGSRPEADDRTGVSRDGAGVTVRVGTLDDASGFFVEDDGPGVPEAERDAVFDSGYSTSDTGTGFGLAIVEGIAEAHGWTVTLTESDDGGARFEFTDVEHVV